MALSDVYNERQDDGTYEPTAAANAAVNCLDQPYPRDPAAYETEARSIEQTAPTVGRLTEYLSLLCAFWPESAKGTAAPLSAPGAPPILVVGTTHDPATPYVWAQRLARELGSGVLLTARAECYLVGHADPLGEALRRLAAYAEAGQFNEAVATGEKSLKLATAAGDARFVALNRRLLEFYRAGRPWREPQATGKPAGKD